MERTQRSGTERGPGTGIYLALVPWVLFSPITQHDTLKAAAVAALIAVIAFSSLVFVPFTEQYARESVSKEFWSTPRFKRVNRQLTVMWGSVFLVMMVSHIVAGAIDTRRGNTIFNWVIPIILIIWAVKRTGEVSEAA